MSDQAFSLENYATDWQKSQDTVVVEGTLQDDGNHYVIDPDPCQLGLLYRVRKEDVTDKRQSRKVHCHGREHQLFIVFIKKNVPVARISFFLSDFLGGGPNDNRLRRTLSVNFRNYSVYRKRWAIKDAVTDELIFDDFLMPRNDAGDTVTLSLTARSNGYGEVHYKHADQSVWTHKNNIEDDDTVDMS
jgi:hypothetical protein